ncbi:helix-turn-helix domain-containing protein [Paenibacillus donghaensis]|uniref:helix-turn-helix domain-containing protein n=1 Tax=Paenibacillus donghaensis TaxID=414771 RepID=UPI0012FC0779|nr:helix-turn-helix transcriptional regulator [Paenibacillus donghaensis]
MDIFSARLKWARERKYISQKDMAEKIGMSPQGYGKIENGQREPNLETLSKLPEILGESVDFLIGVTDFDKHGYNLLMLYKQAFSNVVFAQYDLAEVRLHSHDLSNENVKVDLDLKEKSSLDYIKGWKLRRDQVKDRLLTYALEQIPMTASNVFEELAAIEEIQNAVFPIPDEH